MADAAEMARYRRIATRLWSEADFRSLSSGQPCARMLWLYLLCGPRTTQYPGLVVAREAVMADDLDWSVEDLRRVMDEPSQRGMVKYDRATGVLLVVNAFFTRDGRLRDESKPDNQSLIVGWSKAWDDIPESPLKAEYLTMLRSSCEASGAAFLKAFDASFQGVQHRPTHRPPHRPPHRPTPQDQDQEQDTDLPLLPSGGETVSGLQHHQDAPEKRLRDPVAGLSPEAWLAADTLRAQILNTQPSNAIGRKPWDTEKRTGTRLAWAKECQKLFSVDRRTTREFGDVLRWLFHGQTGDFAFVVHSPSALREKWDRITVAMNRPARGVGEEADNVLRFSPAAAKRIIEGPWPGPYGAPPLPRNKPVVVSDPETTFDDDQEAGES